MSSLHRTTAAGALLGMGAAAVLAWAVLPPAAATQPGEAKALAELVKRVTKLEAEMAELRQALVKAGGGAVDHAAQAKNCAKVAHLRAADLLQRAQNLHAVLRDVVAIKVAGPGLNGKINDLNNDLCTLWMKMAGSGLGADPYLDGIQIGASGVATPKPPSDLGIPGPYAAMGLPRLYEMYLEESGITGKAAAAKATAFKKLVLPYANPGVFPHREFYERAYNDYRNGQNQFTPQYQADLQALDQWLMQLEEVLAKVPGHFEKTP
jgi:hypothetical protein